VIDNKLFCLVVLLVLSLSTLSNADVIYQDNSYSLDEWGNQVHINGGVQVSLESIDELNDSLESGLVGVVDTHFISFLQVDSVLFSRSKVLLTFPDGFNLEGFSSVQYLDSDENNTDFIVDSSIISDNTLAVYLDSDGTVPETGSLVQLTVFDVTSATISDQYQIILTTLDSADVVKCGPVLSGEFKLSPSDLDSIEIQPNTVQQVKAGESLFFGCNCFDSYGNQLQCESVAWSANQRF